MFKKLPFIFVFSLVLFSLLTFVGIRYVNNHEASLEKEQSNIIQEQIRDRFKLFLKVPLSLGLAGSDFYSFQEFQKLYQASYAKNFLTLNKDILGLSLLNEEGKIVSVYPETENLNAKGKITQNIKLLMDSLNRKETFWFSPPFKLFQGGQGFVFYIPVYKNKIFRGWFAPVISTARFDEEFKLNEYLKTYNLIIKDAATGIPYFSTGVDPDENEKIFRSTHKLYNRDIEFLSWKKVPPTPITMAWYVVLFIAFIPAALITFMAKLYRQRKAARHQLRDISVLLRLTSREALAKLIDLQAEFYKMGSTENMTFVTNLMEQIELLQTLADSDEEIKIKEQEFLPLLQNEISSIQEIINKKSISVSFSPESMKEVLVNVNGWILRNCVLSNILIHSIIHAESGTGINIDSKLSDDKTFITFHTQMVMRGESDTPAVNIDRRMEVARHALSLFKGELFIQHDLGGGIIIRIIFPH